MSREKYCALRGNTKKIVILSILYALVALQLPSVYASGLTIDGIVEETEWTWLLDDLSQQPNFSVYYSSDSAYVYLAIVTNDANENSDVLEFAFRGAEKDYWIEVKPGISTNFRLSGGTWQGWWKGLRTGTPSGVNIAEGETDGYRSYEISIEVSKLGDKASSFPEKFKFWIKVQDGTPNGPVNYYSDNRADWWWVIEQEVGDDDESPPMFMAPELPLGTIMSLISMLAAFSLFVKRPFSKKY